MAIQTCTGAQLRCSMGIAPSVFNATPKPLLTGGRPAGNIQDFVPILNVAPFGLCRSPSNPVVAAATAAAAGTLTPMPCVPATVAPWSPGAAMVQLAGVPALSHSSTLSCMWSGVITITDPGQAVVQIS